MISFDQFKANWLGRIVDYDHVYGYQCVDLILQYIYECYGINSGVAGNAIDYWTKTGVNGFNAPLLTKFQKLPTNEAVKGDIVVLRGLTDPAGHVGIATGNIDATNVEILEQNGQDGNGSGVGGDVIRVRYVARNRVAGILRPITASAPAAPAPAASGSGNSVFLPASVASWAVYRVGSGLRKGTSDQVGNLAPAKYGGLTYAIVSWVADNAVVIDTQSFGRVTIWVKNTDAQIKNAAPAAPAPPPAPAAPVHPYTIEAITPKQVKLNKNTHRWGLNYDNFTAINANPEGDIAGGTIVTAVAILHHNIGYNYYLENAGVASGYNVVDCDDYQEPKPVNPTPTPPAGPLSAPSSETYEVVVPVPGYISSNQAINHVNKKVTVPADTYFVFNKRLPAYNVTKTPGTPGAWINSTDNVVAPPAPDPAVAEAAQKAADEAAAKQKAADLPDFAYTYKAFAAPQLYVAMRDLPVIDLTGKKSSVKMKKYDITWISGTFEVKGVDYAMPTSGEEKGLWFGIAWTDPTTNTANLELEAEVFNGKTSIEERQATKSLTKTDRLLLAGGHLRNFVLGFLHFFAKIKPRKTTK